jgi:tRNA A64-2'-O-ribosylphosphate transferase
MPPPLSESDILFPHLSNSPSISNTLSSIKRSALSINNRLNSIISDSQFVASVAEAYGLPLVANERCGSWYIPLDKKTDGVYFKSTDGHMGQWSFSLRRLNLQLVDVLQKYGGAVVVDSTRRGKSMPDALSKTIPIWCCVLNRALFGGEGVKHELYTPPHAVSESEHAQIENRIDGLVRQFFVTYNSPWSSYSHPLTSTGNLQTQYPISSLHTHQTPPPNLGNPAVLTTRLATNIQRLLPHRPVYSFSPRPRRRSL